MMKNKHLSCLWVFSLSILLFPLNLHAQKSLTGYDIATQLPSFYPTSVGASQLFRKPAENIDYATGRATIRIPLYEIRTASFTLPISLCYVTSGIKANQLTGTIGLGWQLEAEPMITRDVRGLPDEQSWLQDSLTHYRTPEIHQLQLGVGVADVQQDIFHFRLLNGSGMFILQESDNRYFRPTLITKEPVRISLGTSPINSSFSNSLLLVDLAGNSYTFGATEQSRELTKQSGSGEAVTSWKASEIRSPDGDWIRFSYLSATVVENQAAYYDFYSVEDGSRWNYDPLPGVPPFPGYWKGVSGKMNYYYYAGMENNPSGNNVPIIKKWGEEQDKPYSEPGASVYIRPIQQIDFPGGQVAFSYNTSSRMLEKVEIKSAGTVLRTITLVNRAGYNKRYFLDQVRFSNNYSGLTEKYAFKYHSDISLPLLTKGIDHWGYYNGATGNTDLVAEQEVFVSGNPNLPSIPFRIGGARNKQTTETYATAYSLSEVIFPSGGSTKYVYEPHWLMLASDAGDQPTASIQGGGIRLRAIIEDPVVGKPILRTLEYRHPIYGNGIGTVRFPMCSQSFMQSLNKHYVRPSPTWGPEIVYSVRSRVYSNINSQTDDMTVYYASVAENINNRQTVYHFNNSSSFSCGDEPRFGPPLYHSGLLTHADSCEQCVGPYSFVTEQATADVSWGLVNEIKPTATFDSYLDPLGMISLSLKQLYQHSYSIRTLQVVAMGSSTPFSQKTVRSEKNRPFRQTERRQYDVSTHLTSAISTDNERVEFSYASDYQGGVYNLMQRSNDLSTPIETRHYQNGVLTKKRHRTYVVDPASTRGYSLSQISESTDGSARVIESYARYLSCGKPTEVTRQDGTIVSIVWAFDGKSPLAVIENLSSDAVRSQGINLTTLSTSHLIAESVYTQLDGLRVKYPLAKVTTYRYRPLVGLERVTGPDGVSVYYTYDPSGRLLETRDNQYSKTNTYEYHEVNY